MKKIAFTYIAVALMACTQAQAPSAETPAGDIKAQAPSTTQTSGGNTTAEITATTPILSLLIGTSITPAAKGMWCLKEGTAPFTKISAQDESIAAPIENQSAPLPGVTKDTATQQTPGTARITSQSGDSTFQIQWLSKGIKGDARIVVQGDSLSFTDAEGTATFQRCQ